MADIPPSIDQATFSAAEPEMQPILTAVHDFNKRLNTPGSSLAPPCSEGVNGSGELSA